ncbi:MAG: shikimate kinase [Pseudomonadota bacterium]
MPHLQRSIVLVGLMGAGKTSVGRRLAARLGVALIDSDEEIVAAAGMSIPEIFETQGEAVFRDGERRVIARLLAGPPAVIATGGGAFMDAEVRAGIAAAGVSVWLKASLATLWSRLKGKPGRPLLAGPTPREALAELLAKREPTYALADLTVESPAGGLHEAVADAILRAVAARDAGLPAAERCLGQPR